MAGRRSPLGPQYASGGSLWSFPYNSVVSLQRRADLELTVFRCVAMYLEKQKCIALTHEN